MTKPAKNTVKMPVTAAGWLDRAATWESSGEARKASMAFTRAVKLDETENPHSLPRAPGIGK